MKILPIQYQIINNKNNKPQKAYKNSYLRPSNSSTVDFRGMIGVYKGLNGDITLLSKEEATKLVAKKIKNNDTNDALNIILHTTQQIKNNVPQNKYYKGMINKLINLNNDGFSLSDTFYKNDVHFNTQKDFDTYIRRVKELVKMGCPKHWASVLWDDIGDKNKIQKLVELRQRGEEKAKRLSIVSITDYITSDDLDELFFNFSQESLAAVKILGQKGLLSSLEKKYDTVLEQVCKLSHINTEIPQYEVLLELTNPRESKKYLKNEAKIKKMKSKFQTTQNKEELIKEINLYTNANKNLVANSFKDYRDKIDLANIYLNLQENSIARLNSLLESCQKNPSNEKQTLDKAINALVTTDEEGHVCKSINFINSKYLRKILESDSYFKNYFEIILYILNNTKKNSEEAFDRMTINSLTKTQFENEGINYDKWTKFNPESKIQKSIQFNVEDKKQFVIRNIEKDLSSEYWDKIPQKERDNLFTELYKAGYTLKEVQVANYDEDGFADGLKTVSKLYKDDKPVKFEDLSLLFKTIRKYINKNSFWNTQNENLIIEISRKEILNHLVDLRSTELKLAGQKTNAKFHDITVQKVDMNNVEHALFLGNDASCCTAIGSGCNQWSAPTYVLSKMVSAIEVLDKNEPVGNTMCYIAKIDNKPALLLDNIELQNKYQYNDEIRDMIFEYAKKLTTELGQSDMPIYAGINRHKINMENYPIENKHFTLIGTTENIPIYVDFDTSIYYSKMSKTFQSDLYKIR